jgi:tetratricopeptide (TPR) repeat protein
MSLAEILVTLMLAAPSAGAGEPASDAAGETLREALRTLDARIAILEGLEARRAAGERVSIDAVRSADEAPRDATEVLLRERKRIEDLKDAIRIAEAERRRAARAEEEERPAGVDAPVAEAPSDPVRPAEARSPVVEEELPRDLDLRRRLAEARYREGDVEGALRLYASVAASAADDTWSRLRQARCLERLGRVAAARAAYEALVRDFPEDEWARAATWSLGVLDLRRPAPAEGEEEER